MPTQVPRRRQRLPADPGLAPRPPVDLHAAIPASVALSVGYGCRYFEIHAEDVIAQSTALPPR